GSFAVMYCSNLKRLYVGGSNRLLSCLKNGSPSRMIPSKFCATIWNPTIFPFGWEPAVFGLFRTVIAIFFSVLLQQAISAPWNTFLNVLPCCEIAQLHNGFSFSRYTPLCLNVSCPLSRSKFTPSRIFSS
ncbi:hypothetical protein PMAYCL1PPCAC_24901, partial [Pristionchus mayeri]